MADVEWFQRVQNEPGDRVSPSVDIAEASRVFARVDASLADWDNAELFTEVIIETSVDAGQSWQLSSSATFVGGARTKDGQLPYLEMVNKDNTGQRVAFGRGMRCRVRHVQNRRARLGITGVVD